MSTVRVCRARGEFMESAALYIRLSKEDMDKLHKGDESASIENQRMLLQAYAREHGFCVAAEYVDEDYSGLYDDRPGFDRLLCDAQKGSFEIVLAKSQSRFTRNMEHVEKYLHHVFPSMGIRFIGIVDGTDTSRKENKKARQIYGLVNEWYCEDLSENIRAVFRQKMKSGQFLGGFAPYGYMKNPRDGHFFLVDEEAAQIVRRIYRLFLEGRSTREICRLLESDGILNPTAYKKSKGYSYANSVSDKAKRPPCAWSQTTVKRILSNETYTGKLIQGTCEKLSYKDKKVVPVPKERWVIVENHHEAIIDRQCYEKVQQLKTTHKKA